MGGLATIARRTVPFLALLLSAPLVATPLTAALTTGTPTFGPHVALPDSRGYGEPSIAVAPDGTVYVTAPGSSDSPVWRSANHGASFTKVASSRGSSGDSDVAIDSAGTVYVSDLFSNVPVSASTNRATAFQTVTSSAAGGSNDRQWLTAGSAGRVWSSWRDGSTERVAISTDSARTWTRVVAATGVGLQGNILATSDTDLWIPYQTGTQIRLLRSTDGGLTWTSAPVATGASSLLFPAVAVDDAGAVYVAWAQGDGLTNSRTSIRVATSTNGGATFGAARTLSSSSAYNIFPWILAGAPGRVAITWFEGVPPTGPQTDPNFATLTTWHVGFASSIDASAASPTWTTTRAASNVHTGPICTEGTLCIPQRNPVAMNRALLDFFEMAELADGRIAIAFAADEPGNFLWNTHLRVVVQNGGAELDG